MRKLIAVAALGALVALPQAAFAGDTATQIVSCEVKAINEITVSGNPEPLVVEAATAGSEPTAATNASTSYAITTNGTKKITAKLDSNMPVGVDLSLTAAAPAGGTGLTVPLTSTPAEIVTGVSKVAVPSLALTYELKATAAAGVVAPTNKTVTLTITD